MSINLLMILLVYGLPCVDSEDNIFFLTSNSTKSWTLRLGGDVQSCATTNSTVFADNKYIFSTDGAFQFDHGTVLEDPACTGENCCNDLVNITGKWEFINGGKGLRVIAAYETGNPANRIDITLIEGTIKHLDQETLRLSHVNAESGVTEIFEFKNIR